MAVLARAYEHASGFWNTGGWDIYQTLPDSPGAAYPPKTPLPIITS
jgi:hypothetical protein